LEAWIPWCLSLAVAAPLVAFFAILATGRALPGSGRPGFWISLGAILASFALSSAAACLWWATGDGIPVAVQNFEEPAAEVLRKDGPAGRVPAADALAEKHGAKTPRMLAGPLLFFAQFGTLRFELTYLIDGLTILFFPLIAGVATCVILYAGAYMDDELRPVIDEHATGEDDGPVRRPGRYARFFQFLCLFCFSMLGLVLVGDLLGVFIFWELVGAASYFLIGFYIEREAANAAANKAFLVNRIGDFGMLTGIAMFVGAFGTLALADRAPVAAERGVDAGLFSQVAERTSGASGSSTVVAPSAGSVEEASTVVPGREGPIWPFVNWHSYLTVAGLLLFCGCIGKSAQVPLHVWLPDAMEGPTPVSALVHSATMVAAGVYLLGRVYPLLSPDALAVIAIVGIVTALAGAAMATVATDLKKALAFSTMSQLGLMTLSMGVGGWFAGLFHLATHAFFKCLLFLGAGAVQHGTGTLDLERMGGLGRKMPLTAGLMLIGSIALSGLGLPLIVLPGLGFAGFHSKDAILEQAFVFAQERPWGWILFGLAACVGALTAYYVARMWLLMFLDRQESHADADDPYHAAPAHDPGAAMLFPIAVLAFLAVVAGWTGWQSVIGSALAAFVATLLFLRLSASSAWRRPAMAAAFAFGGWSVLSAAQTLWLPDVSLQMTLQGAMPPDLAAAETHAEGAVLARAVAGGLALLAAVAGATLAWLRFGRRRRLPLLDSALARPTRLVLLKRLYVDDFYRTVFVDRYFSLTRTAVALDRWVFDRAVDGIASGGRATAQFWTKWVDDRGIDGGFDWFGRATLRAGSRLRQVQTGSLRQYVFFLAAAAVALFVLVFFFLDPEAALDALRQTRESR
jgi:NADH-quinone oxidoreductase subunit L